MPESTGHVVVWRCWCSDAADDPATLPDRCPGHDAPRVGQVVENEHPGPTQPGHICRDTQCDTPTTRPARPAGNTSEHVARLRRGLGEED